jgi:hypothetical protein
LQLKEHHGPNEEHVSGLSELFENLWEKKDKQKNVYAYEGLNKEGD